MNNLYTYLLMFCLLLSLKQVSADDQLPLYIIFDGSNSMWGELPDKARKIEVAKQVFNDLDASLFEGRNVALRIYGHRRARDCSDTELVVPFATGTKIVDTMSEQVNAVSPRGKTPITRSLKAALEDIGDQAAEILLISDGIETCDSDPCELVESWRNQNINLRIHVVGLGLDDMSRAAMQCISHASGTKYLDARSANELSEAIISAANSTPPTAGEPDPQPQPPRAEFKIKAVDEQGNYLPVLGTISQPGMEPSEIASNFRYVFPGGEYQIAVGVPTINGELYKPIEQTITVKDVGQTLVEVTLQRPPQVRTRFIENDTEIRGVLATAYQQDKELFNLRPEEDYFILPGDYEFKATLNKDNVFSVQQSITEGDDKFIDFVAIETVRAYFVVKVDGADQTLRQHQQLFQNEQLKYKVHFANGADIQPGVYTMRSDHALTPYEIKDIEVTSEDKQTIELIVPMATARLQYQFLQPPETNDMRCWLSRIDDEDRVLANSKALQCDSSDVFLVEGRYRVRTWSTLGNFEDTVFDIVVGETKQIDILQTQ